MPESTTRTGPGLRIARIGGVPVHIGASWLVLAAVIVALAGQSLAPLGPMAYAVGVGWALALLVAVLVHESAHAVAARACGLPVVRVVADLWGGHTAYDARSATPGRSALIAVAGPLANVVLAGLGLLGGALVGDGVAGLVVRGFGLANIFLAAFNLLPGLPLDGGQLVDALVWKVTGRRESGLVVAGWCGRVVAALVALWVVRPLLQGGVPGLTDLVWGLLICGFLWQGATAAIRTGRARRMLGAVRLVDVAHRAVLLPASTPLATAQRHQAVAVALDEHGRPTLVLVPVSEDDLDGIPPTTPISALLTRVPDECVVEAPPDADVTDVVVAMQSTRVGLVVLTQAGTPWATVDGEALNAALEAARHG